MLKAVGKICSEMPLGSMLLASKLFTKHVALIHLRVALRSLCRQVFIFFLKLAISFSSLIILFFRLHRVPKGITVFKQYLLTAVQL